MDTSLTTLMTAPTVNEIAAAVAGGTVGVMGTLIALEVNRQKVGGGGVRGWALQGDGRWRRVAAAGAARVAVEGQSGWGAGGVSGACAGLSPGLQPVTGARPTGGGWQPVL